MERIYNSATSERRTRRKINQSTRKSTRHLPIISGDNLKADPIQSGEISDEHSMKVWVKEEVDLDPVIMTQDRLIDNLNDDMEHCWNNGESSTFNLNSDHDRVIKKEHSTEYVLPDNVTSLNEKDKVNLLERQLESSNARNLELEKINHKLKAEIKQLKKKQKKCSCVRNQVKKKDMYAEGTNGYVERVVTFCPNCRKDLSTIKGKNGQHRHLKNCGLKFKCSFCIVTYTREYELRKHMENCGFRK